MTSARRRRRRWLVGRTHASVSLWRSLPTSRQSDQVDLAQHTKNRSLPPRGKVTFPMSDSKRYRTISTILRTEEASWITQQQRAFTGWVNLKISGKTDVAAIVNIDKDFADGLQLHALLRQLTKKEIAGALNSLERLRVEVAVKFTLTGTLKNPAKTMIDCLGNLQICFAFMTKEEKLKLVNIGPTDLQSGNKKLALGLVWALILTYQIGGGSLSSSAPASTGSGSAASSTSTSGSDTSKRKSTEITETSAKRMLLEWCAERSGEAVANFETSFCDGRIFAKVLNSIDHK
jgi:hypothetical protein